MALCACNLFSASSENGRLRAVGYFIHYFFTAMGRQAMKEDGIFVSMTHQFWVN